MNAATQSRAGATLPAGHDLYLDWLRGLAALLVFVTHVRSGYFAKWGDLDAASQTHLNYLLFFLTRLGREAVVIFFVLSGYLVGGHAVADYLRGRYSLGRYMVARVSRLYVVVVPALLLTGLLDALHAWDGARDGIQSLLVNLLFLQGIAGEPYGSNGPFWSLSYEWWFYILFGFALAAVARRSFPGSALALLLVATSAALLWLKCPTILFMFPLWLLGVVARSLPASGLPKYLALPCVSVGLCIALAVSTTRWDWQGDLLVGLATTAFIYFFKDATPLRYPWFAVGKTLAACSFSLYALHYSLNSFVLSVFVPQRLTHAGIVSWLGWLLIVGVEAAICWVFYWTFERRTPLVRAWLLRTFFSSVPARARGVNIAGLAFFAVLGLVARPLDARAASPQLYAQPAHESPVRGEGDDLLLLAGYGLDSDDTVIYEALDDTTKPLVSPTALPTESGARSGMAQVVSTANVPYSLTVKLPAAVLGGQSYVIWVRNAVGEWSNAVRINDARPLWVTPSYAYATGVVAGLPRHLKVVGRNLQPAAGAVTSLRLVGPELLTLSVARDSQPSRDLKRYAAEFALPARLAPGEYTLQFTRDGVSWVTLENQAWTVRPDPTPAREFALSAPEVGACHPDDGADDTACMLAAIKAANAVGGGTVVLGPGNWDLHSAAPGVARGDGLILPRGVSLKGSGAAATRVLWHPDGAEVPVNPAFTLLGHNTIQGITFRDTRVYHLGDTGGGLLRLGEIYDRLDPHAADELRSVEDVVITHNVFDKPFAALGNGGLPMRRIFITYNEFGAYHTALLLGGSRYNTRYEFRMDDSVVAYNTFAPGGYLDPAIEQGTMASSLGAALRVDFSHNVADGTATRYLYSPHDPRGWRAGFFWYMSGNLEMMLVSQNEATCTGDKIGDGEAIAYDADVNAMAFTSVRPVSGATSTTVTVQGTLRPTQQNRRVKVEDYYVGLWVQIAAGPGVGQLRKIQSYTIDSARSEVTFTVSPAWDVQPQAGASRIDVAREYWQVYTVDNDVDQRKPLCQKSNRSRPRGGVIGLWSQTADSVVEGNRQYDTDGIILDQTYSAEDPACPTCGTGGTIFQSFVDIRDNTIDGEYDWNATCSMSGIQGWYGAAPTPSSPPPVAGYAVSIAHNTIRHADGLHGGAISWPLSWTAGPEPHRWRLVDNLLIQHNALSDISGPAPGGACEQPKHDRVGISIDRSALVWHTVLYGNSCTNVTAPLHDGGLATVRVCPSSAKDSCECR